MVVDGASQGDQHIVTDFYASGAYNQRGPDKRVSTYHDLGIDIDLFTPVFAVSRVSGWTAHVIEQLNDNRLIRPRADYQGPAYPNPYVPLEKR